MVPQATIVDANMPGKSKPDVLIMIKLGEYTKPAWERVPILQRGLKLNRIFSHTEGVYLDRE